MACGAISSGPHFLGSALTAIDCHARTVGAYGYAALAQPGSAVSVALTGLLVVFVALFGMRLLLGPAPGPRDVVGDMIKIGVVLTLATSWPAWRAIGYGLVIDGPGEIARAIGLAAGLPGARGDLIARLDRVDEALTALNLWGAGRLRGISQGDWLQLGIARNAFLLGTLVPVGLVRLATGLLLAIAPLMAGLLLFAPTRGLFAGWLRGLAACFLASTALTIALGVELAIVEPWLQEVLQRRIGGEELLSLPPEALALTTGFAAVTLGLVMAMTRVAFHPAVARLVALPTLQAGSLARGGEGTVTIASAAHDEATPHARSVALSIAESLRREERFSRIAGISATPALAGSPGVAAGGAAGPGPQAEALGSSYRRAVPRGTAASARRDSQP